MCLLGDTLIHTVLSLKCQGVSYKTLGMCKEVFSSEEGTTSSEKTFVRVVSPYVDVRKLLRRRKILRESVLFS